MDGLAIRNAVGDYISGGSFRTLRDVLTEAYNPAKDDDVLEVCRAIEWEMADYTEGLIGEKELRYRLSAVLSRRPVRLALAWGQGAAEAGEGAEV